MVVGMRKEPEAVEIDVAPFDLVVEDVDLIVVPQLHQEPAAQFLKGRLSLSRPLVRHLTPDLVGGDAALVGFLEEMQRDFFLLTLICTFRPGIGQRRSPFIDAAVGVRLTSPTNHEQPVAWSLSPKLATSPVRRNWKFTFGAKLVIAEPALEISSEQAARDHHIIGFGEQQSDPEWRLRNTSQHALIGDTQLSVIVKSEIGVPVQADIIVAATVRNQRLGPIQYRAQLPPVIQTVDLRRQANLNSAITIRSLPAAEDS
jgi:hypothetical protein